MDDGTFGINDDGLIFINASIDAETKKLYNFRVSSKHMTLGTPLYVHHRSVSSYVRMCLLMFIIDQVYVWLIQPASLLLFCSICSPWERFLLCSHVFTYVHHRSGVCKIDSTSKFAPLLQIISCDFNWTL